MMGKSMSAFFVSIQVNRSRLSIVEGNVSEEEEEGHALDRPPNFCFVVFVSACAILFRQLFCEITYFEILLGSVSVSRTVLRVHYSRYTTVEYRLHSTMLNDLRNDQGQIRNIRNI